MEGTAHRTHGSNLPRPHPGRKLTGGVPSAALKNASKAKGSLPSAHMSNRIVYMDKTVNLKDQAHMWRSNAQQTFQAWMANYSMAYTEQWCPARYTVRVLSNGNCVDSCCHDECGYSCPLMFVSCLVWPFSQHVASTVHQCCM